eukprot:15317535-Alexandrium_andersonii.AAC.1
MFSPQSHVARSALGMRVLPQDRLGCLLCQVSGVIMWQLDAFRMLAPGFLNQDSPMQPYLAEAP